MRHLGSTPAFRRADGTIVPGSIAETSYVRIGGIDQWIMIRGADITNPAMIMLHGGPGMTEMRFFRQFNAPLENAFTIVHWDQRGAGKSFDRSIPRASMTAEQLVSDLDELVDLVCRRLGKTQVVIFGHSWGSVLGVLYAARFPRKVALYVGCAQIGDWPAAEAASYAYAVAEAKRQDDQKALYKLRTIGDPPYPARSVFVERTITQRLAGQLGAKVAWGAARCLLGGPESSIWDLPNLVRGFRSSMDAMWSDVSKLNLIELVPALAMPVVFFVSARDHFVPAETTQVYFDALTAPSKQLVWFDSSGHEPFVDEPEKFNAAMLEIVRPLALARPKPHVA